MLVTQRPAADGTHSGWTPESSPRAFRSCWGLGQLNRPSTLERARGSDVCAGLSAKGHGRPLRGSWSGKHEGAY